MKVIFLSRHQLSPAQVHALKALHGEDVEMEVENVSFDGLHGLEAALETRSDSFVYAVVPTQMAIAAALAGATFGLFENHPGKRERGDFGLASVYHVQHGTIEQVYKNPDPESDFGEVLAPVQRAG